MRILLVRHGESEGNVDIAKYIEKGDSRVGLTPKGWAQALQAGQFLKRYYQENQIDQWPVLFLSPYQRTRETLSGILHGMDGAIAGKPKLYEDWRLTEKFFGAASLMRLPLEGMNKDVVKTILEMSALIYKNDPHSAKNLFGESTKETQAHVKGFIDGTLRRDIEGGKDNFLIVAHGAVVQAFIMSWMHVSIDDKQKIGNPNNCDVIELTGSKGNWRVIKIYDGEEFKPAARNMMEGITPFSYEDLPPVPQGLICAPL